jgi:hypothetical protein
MKPHDARKIFVSVAVFFISLIHYCLPAGAGIHSARPIPNRPDGWNGITWGAGPDILGIKPLIVDYDAKNGACFIIPGETTSLGNAQVDKIKYYFNENKLVRIDFLSPKSQEGEILRFATENFGRPQLVGAKEDEFVWFDDDVCIYIKFAANREQLTILRYVLKKFANGSNVPTFQFKIIPNKHLIEEILNVKIGDNLKSFDNDMIFVKNHQKHPEVAIYRRLSEKKFLIGMELKTIRYHFLRSKLFVIDISFDAGVSKKQLREFTTSNLGEPNFVSADELYYQWYDGSPLGICLSFNNGPNGEYGQLLLGDMDLLETK